MKIIADQNIPYVKEAFGSLGEVHTYAGKKINSKVAQDADILLVRSVTRVDERLLSKSRVKFVASATIGKDHIDEEYLQENAIGFTTAPGSNANSVAEYVLTAMAHCTDTLRGKSLAIVGVGNIGSLLYEKASLLGMKTFLNDPPKANTYHSFLSLQDALAGADFVSLHVPLTYGGDWPTHGLVNETFLGYMKNGATLINASRGKTLVEDALLKHSERLAPYVLDVWPSEPIISDDLLQRCLFATPHIAGYSFDGKCRGTELIYQAATSFFFQQEVWKKKEVYESIEREVINFKKCGSIESVLKTAYDIQRDSTQLIEGVKGCSDSEREDLFRSLRREYPRRLEYKHYTVKNCNDSLINLTLKKLGFHIE